MPGLLIFTPTYGGLLRPETVGSVEAQRYDGRVTYEIGRFNPFPEGDLRNVTAQYQRARDVFLAGDYDALLTVEHDMVLPLHAAQTLWDSGADVAYGAYLFRQGLVLNLRRYVGDDRIGPPLDAHPGVAQVRVSGVGLGCTLIRRSVLERITFRPDPAMGTCDVPFALDCLAAGVVSIGCFDVGCGHVHDRMILQPYRDTQTGMVTAWPTQP